MRNLTSETEAYFEQLNRDRAATQTASLFIADRLREALGKQDIPLLLSLIPYIETGEGELLCKYIGETHRLLRILYIIRLEQKYHMNLFCTGCPDQKALMDKYLLTLFALRRLLFRLSQSSMEGATLFLQQNQLSVFAVHIITQEDLILPDDALYEKIQELHAHCWSDEEARLFASLIEHR